jgi:hypothetical protein
LNRNRQPYKPSARRGAASRPRSGITSSRCLARGRWTASGAATCRRSWTVSGRVAWRRRR